MYHHVGEPLLETEGHKCRWLPKNASTRTQKVVLLSFLVGSALLMGTMLPMSRANLKERALNLLSSSSAPLEQDNALVCGGVDDGCTNMGIGDGDCDADSDCVAGLTCGTDNCRDFRPAFNWPDYSNSWDKTDDCCYKPTQKINAESDNGLFCAGTNGGCTNMGIGDGDCDVDSECAAGLKCGTDNCANYRPSGGWPVDSGDDWDTTDDCCYKPSAEINLEADTGLACAGVDDGCTNMGIGDGDCDSDSECASGLKCGTDNCANYRPSGGWPVESEDEWDTTDDCCYKP